MYLTLTIIFYCVACLLWLLWGFVLYAEGYGDERLWKIWRSALPLGLITVWLWPIIIPAVVIWVLYKTSVDAIDLFKTRGR